MLPLEPNEDLKIFMSQSNRYPSPIDFQLEYQYREEIVFNDGVGANFEVHNFYFGIFSMSGLSVRVGCGFRVDPFGSNAALMQKIKLSDDQKLAEEKARQEKKDNKIEEAIFAEPSEEIVNASRFR